MNGKRYRPPSNRDWVVMEKTSCYCDGEYLYSTNIEALAIMAQRLCVSGGERHHDCIRMPLSSDQARMAAIRGAAMVSKSYIDKLISKGALV
jgi:hypothetical protein